MAYSTERQHPRVSVGLPVEMRCLTESFARRAQTANLSFGGCYVEMMQPLQPHVHLEVTLWINGEKLRAWAEVVSNHRGVGNGIKFVRVSREDQEKLQAYIDAALRESHTFCRRPAALSNVQAPIGDPTK